MPVQIGILFVLFWDMGSLTKENDRNFKKLTPTPLGCFLFVYLKKKIRDFIDIALRSSYIGLPLNLVKLAKNNL